MTVRPNLLLDTCALLFTANGTKVSEEAEHEISEAAYDSRLYVSPISAWEIGVGVAKSRLKLPADPLGFFNRFLKSMNTQLTELSPEILVNSSALPGSLHGDPADRILIASARHLDMILITSDRPILRYGAEGYVRTIAC